MIYKDTPPAPSPVHSPQPPHTSKSKSMRSGYQVPSSASSNETIEPQSDVEDKDRCSTGGKRDYLFFFN